MRIVQFEAFRIRIPFKRKYVHAEAGREEGENVVVRVRSDGSMTGIGETIPRGYLTGETPASVMESLTKDKRLSPGAWAVAETSTHNRLPPQIGYLRAVDTRSYGDTRITFYVDKPHGSAKSKRRHHEFKNGNLPRLF